MRKVGLTMLELWTDGSCKNNGKTNAYGGWAYVVIKDNQIIFKRYGSQKGTTNNQMEMKAVIEALKYANLNADFEEKIEILSDSAYVVNCFIDKWYIKWRQNNWIGVKNIELWKELIDLYESFGDNIQFKKVKGHKGIINNELCDMLANKGASEAK